MTKAQQRVLADLSGQPYGVVSKRMARTLLADGLVRSVVVSPPPEHGVAVRLTARGRAAATTPTPA